MCVLCNTQYHALTLQNTSYPDGLWHVMTISYLSLSLSVITEIVSGYLIPSEQNH